MILLANSVHPDARPVAHAAARQGGDHRRGGLGITARGVTLTGYNETLAGAGARREVARNAATRTGLDVLAEQKFQPLPASASG